MNLFRCNMSTRTFLHAFLLTQGALGLVKFSFYPSVQCIKSHGQERRQMCVDSKLPYEVGANIQEIQKTDIQFSCKKEFKPPQLSRPIAFFFLAIIITFPWLVSYSVRAGDLSHLCSC